MAHIVLINPRFEHSYWGLEYMLPIAGKRASMPVAALPLLAALTPPHHTVKIVDESVEELDYDSIRRADIVGVTGMSVQRFRMKEILSRLKEYGCFTVVGGAWITVQEDYFKELADVIFIGEAEQTWPEFLNHWGKQCSKQRYEQSHKTDMSTVPVPRLDLLQMKHYMSGSIQISRGCPFLCEFCDIIVTFGRTPRIKQSHQVIAELEALRKEKVKTVFIVDDNLIGNKRDIKPIIREVALYQEAHGFPFRFFTEASLDLAEDDELMGVMANANIEAVFIGIESPNEASLEETKKYQNVRPSAGSIEDRVARIQQAGMEVYAGMIVGFDNDNGNIFKAQKTFLQKTHIPEVMLGMLFAIPKTPLHIRLGRENRLDLDDVSRFGTNVIPMNLGRLELLENYVDTMKQLHSPEAFFERLDGLYFGQKLRMEKLGREKYISSHFGAKLRFYALYTIAASILFFRLMMKITDKNLKKEYRRRIAMALKRRRSPSWIVRYVAKCAFHYHAYKLSESLDHGRLASTI